MRKMLIYICITSLIILASGAVIYVIDMSSYSYEWESSEFKNKYESISNWEKIQSGPLTGFRNEVDSVSELTYNPMKSDPCPNVKSLRTSRGMISRSYCLKIDSNENSFYIGSTSTLRETFAPVETADEAVSFVAATQVDIVSCEMSDQSKSQEDQKVLGETAKISDGYLARVGSRISTDYQPTKYSKRIYKISNDGYITQLAHLERGDRISRKKFDEEKCEFNRFLPAFEKL